MRCLILATVLALTPGSILAHTGSVPATTTPPQEKKGPEFKLEKLSDRAYCLYGRGGNVGFLVTDAGVVVVDEVVGQWVSLLLLPLTPMTVVLGFLLFRLLDVLKPWPARDFERLPGGWGIMADDVMAGIYANLLVRVGLLVWPAA